MPFWVTTTGFENQNLMYSIGYNRAIAKFYSFSSKTVEVGLSELPRPGAEPKLTSRQEHRVVALACTDAGQARELAEATAMTGTTDSGVPPEECPFWAPVLERLVQDLHRSGVGTLDSFMMSLARTFASELGLPPRWTVAEGAEADALRTLVMDRLLSDADPGAMVELLRLLNRGDITRDVHSRLLESLEALVRMFRGVEGRDVVWGFRSEEHTSEHH